MGKGYVLNVGIVDGFLGVVPIRYEGNIEIHAFRGVASGFGIYNQPLQFSSGNRYLTKQFPNKQFRIGKEAELLRFSRDYHGYLDIINYYAGLLSKASHLLANNMVNSRLGYAIGAKNSQTAEAIREIAWNIENERAPVAINTAVLDNKDNMQSIEPWQNLFANVGQNYIAPEQHEVVEKLWLSACRALGIPTPYEKAEHTIGSENNMMAVAAGTVMDGIVESLELSIAKIKKLYPVEGLEIKREEALYNVQSDGDAEAVPDSNQ